MQNRIFDLLLGFFMSDIVNAHNILQYISLFVLIILGVNKIIKRFKQIYKFLWAKFIKKIMEEINKNN